MTTMAMNTARREARETEREAFEHRRKRRNLIVLVLLLAFVIAVYVVTMVRTDSVGGAG